MTFNDRLMVTLAIKVNKVSMVLPRVTLAMLGLLAVVSLVEVLWEA